jgi:hypothetical protein
LIEVKNKTSKNISIRLLYEIISIIKIGMKVKALNYDFVIFTVPSPLLLLLGVICKRNSFIVDIRDAVWEYLKNKGIVYVPFCILLNVVLKYSCRKAKFVTVTNIAEKKSIIKVTGVNPHIIKNGISKTLFDSLINREYEKGKSNSICITYLGNIGRAQHLDCLVKSVANDDRYSVSLVGSGVELKYLKRLRLELNAKNIFFKDNLPQSELHKEFINSDVLYAQIGNDYSSAVPTKIFEYLTTGKHLLLGLPNGPAKKIFASFSGVSIHEPENQNDLLSVLDRIDFKSSVDREHNVNLLKKSYIRENEKELLLALLREI